MNFLQYIGGIMFRFKFEFFLIQIFSWPLLKMPEKFRYKFGEMIGVLVYYILPKRREVALKNIKLAFPEKNDEEIKKIALGSYKVMIKAFMMTLWISDTCKDDEKVKFDNYELYEEAKQMGKGVILVSLHMGAFEAVQKVALKTDLYTVFRRQKNPYITKLMTEAREKNGVTLVARNSGLTKELVKALKNNRTVYLISDQYDDGCSVEFFGEKTRATTGPMAFGVRYDVPVLLVYNVLDENNVSTIYFDKIIGVEKTGNIKKDTEFNTQKLIYEFERVIKKHPEQWMWFHKRWRNN